MLGLKTCKEMRLVQRIDSVCVEAEDILDEYNDVFTGLGCISNVVHHIQVDQNHKPVVHPPRRVPVTLRSKVKNELDRMEQLDVIESTKPPTG